MLICNDLMYLTEINVINLFNLSHFTVLCIDTNQSLFLLIFFF